MVLKNVKQLLTKCEKTVKITFAKTPKNVHLNICVSIN